MYIVRYFGTGIVIALVAVEKCAGKVETSGEIVSKEVYNTVTVGREL